jgi:predicted nucleic acid-binding protein
MGKSVLVDSNIYIRLLRLDLTPDKALDDWAQDYDLITCGMVRMEVERGIKAEKSRRYIASMFDLMLYVPTTNSLWERASQLAWQLDRQGLILPAQDILIACCARQAVAAVMTLDRHFHSIPELEVIDDPF